PGSGQGRLKDDYPRRGWSLRRHGPLRLTGGQLGKRDQAAASPWWHDHGVTLATDTLARFLDHLAEGLDDAQSSSTQLAARLHMSRFYVDRLVSAALGEPPATLRRRILLERAAYRLITA